MLAGPDGNALLIENRSAIVWMYAFDQEGVAIRTGHHCAQPVMERFCVPATARASLAMYNTRPEIDALGRALQRVREVFA